VKPAPVDERLPYCPPCSSSRSWTAPRAGVAGSNTAARARAEARTRPARRGAARGGGEQLTRDAV